MIKLSIVITTKNRPAFLRENLERFDGDKKADDFEIIVVDDASSPENKFENMQIVSDFHARTGRGTYDYLAEWSGPGGARNRGFVLSKGSHVWFADGDDLVEWNALNDVVCELYRDPDVPLLMLDYNVVYADSKADETITFARSRLYPWECGVMTWHKVVRRDLFVPFVPCAFSEDIDWWMRMCLKPAIDRYVAPGVVAYTYRRLAPGSITATGADRTEGRNARVINELEKIRDIAKNRNRPQPFIEHLDWLLRQYEEGKV